MHSLMHMQAINGVPEAGDEATLSALDEYIIQHQGGSTSSLTFLASVTRLLHMSDARGSITSVMFILGVSNIVLVQNNKQFVLHFETN